MNAPVVPLLPARFHLLAEWKNRWEHKSYLNRAQEQANPGEKKKRQQ